MSAQERRIDQQEVVPPAGAAPSPPDREETAQDEAAHGEAWSGVHPDAAQGGSATDAARAGPAADATQGGSLADAAQAGSATDAAQAGSLADAAQAEFDVDAAQTARSGADVDGGGADADIARTAPSGADADEAPSEVDVGEVPSDVDADDARPEAGAAQDELDVEARADLHERAGKADAYLELAQRTQADFDNYRKRMTREVRAAEARGIGRLARELLPAIDNLERALAAVETAEPMHHLSEGIRLVTAELSAALGRTGIQGYDPKGERFDPVQHEAVAQQPVAGAEPGTVVEVLQPGYRLNEAILRPARVIVAS